MPLADHIFKFNRSNYYLVYNNILYNTILYRYYTGNVEWMTKFMFPVVRERDGRVTAFIVMRLTTYVSCVKYALLSFSIARFVCLPGYIQSLCIYTDMFVHLSWSLCFLKLVYFKVATVIYRKGNSVRLLIRRFKSFCCYFFCLIPYWNLLQK